MRFADVCHLEIPCLQAVYRVFRCWSLLTPTDLWPPPCCVNLLHIISVPYHRHINFVYLMVLEICCLQDFHVLTSVDLKWPSPFTKKIGFLCSLRWTYMPNMKFNHTMPLEIWCLQGHGVIHTRNQHRIYSFCLRQGIKQGSKFDDFIQKTRSVKWLNWWR